MCVPEFALNKIMLLGAAKIFPAQTVPLLARTGLSYVTLTGAFIYISCFANLSQSLTSDEDLALYVHPLCQCMSMSR